MAEVTRDSNGRIRVNKVYCVVDCGIPINPHIIEAQVESAVMYGLSAALYDEIRMENGIVETSELPQLSCYPYEPGAGIRYSYRPV